MCVIREHLSTPGRPGDRPLLYPGSGAGCLGLLRICVGCNLEGGK